MIDFKDLEDLQNQVENAGLTIHRIVEGKFMGESRRPRAIRTNSVDFTMIVTVVNDGLSTLHYKEAGRPIYAGPKMYAVLIRR